MRSLIPILGIRDDNVDFYGLGREVWARVMEKGEMRNLHLDAKLSLGKMSSKVCFYEREERQ